MKLMCKASFCTLMAATCALAQPTFNPSPRTPPRHDMFIALLQGNHNDPAYEAYRTGYSLVLDERWAEARKKFNEVFLRYPSSRYVEDAHYWSTYALAHIDSKKALEKYSQFLKSYPASRYFPDAVADVAALHTAVTPAPAPTMDSALLANQPTPFGLSLSNFRALEVNFARMERTLRHRLLSIRMMHFPGTTPMPFPMSPTAKVDDATRLKIESLRALSEARDDERSFHTFKTIALDKREPLPLREVAIEELSKSRKSNPLPVLAEIARRDPNNEMRNLATLSIGETDGDKSKKLDALTDLFRSLPSGRDEQRAYILDAVAESGGEGAMDFLIAVARKSEDVDLQSSAIDYLGQTCGDKKRCLDVLLDLFNSLPPARKEARQTILYCAADIGNDRAVDFLIRVARSGEDYQLRSDAVCLLGNIGGERAKTALYDILLGH